MYFLMRSNSKMHFHISGEKTSLDKGIYRTVNILPHMARYSERSIYVEIDNFMKDKRREEKVWGSEKHLA